MAKRNPIPLLFVVTKASNRSSNRLEQFRVRILHWQLYGIATMDTGSHLQDPRAPPGRRSYLLDGIVDQVENDLRHTGVGALALVS